MTQASASDWTNQPLPDKFVTVALDRPFSAAEARIIQAGLIPQQMEDKWFIYWQDNSLFMHRSWTGYCVYEVAFNSSAGGIVATEVRINRDADQYTCENDGRDAKLALYLIDALLLHKNVPFPSDLSDTDEAALQAWAEIGRASIGQHPGNDHEAGYTMGTTPMSLSANVRKELGYYVYLYRDPRDGRVFYIGKGRGNRVLSHLNSGEESSKGKLLAELDALGLEPILEILKYRLTESEALLVESTAIDLIDVSNLTNEVRGHGSKHGGRGSLLEIVSQLDAKPVTITDAAILINISRAFRFTLSPQQLYDVTRSAWRVKPESEANFAFAVYRGVVREVYRIERWFPVGTTMRVMDGGKRRAISAKDEGRREFVGQIAEDEIRNKYVGGSVTQYYSKGARNPILYVNC